MVRVRKRCSILPNRRIKSIFFGLYWELLVIAESVVNRSCSVASPNYDSDHRNDTTRPSKSREQLHRDGHGGGHHTGWLRLRVGGAGLTPTMMRWRFVYDCRHPAEAGKLKTQGTGSRQRVVRSGRLTNLASAGAVIYLPVGQQRSAHFQPVAGQRKGSCPTGACRQCL